MKDYIVVSIIVLTTLIEITPIKINPISWFGELFNKRLSKKIDDMQKNVDDISKNQDLMEIDLIRHRILAMEALIRKGERLKRYQYESTFKDIDKWNWYHIKYPQLNGMINAAIENIKETYKKETFEN